MQGLNFNYDSTYIQTTTQENQSFQTQEKTDSSVSFMSLVQREIRESDSFLSSAEVVKTDTDVLKSTYEHSTENDQSVSKSDTDVKKSDELSQKEKINSEKKDDKVEVAKKSSEDENEESEVENKKVQSSNLLNLEAVNFVKNLLENQSSKNKIAKSTEKNSQANSIKNTGEKKSSTDAILQNLKKDFDLDSLKEKINFLDEDFLDADSLAKSSSKDFSELIVAQELSLENPKSFLDNLNNSITKDDGKNIQLKNVKDKKDAKKFTDVFSVTDLRTQKADSQEPKSKSQFVTSVKQTSSDSVQVTMDLNTQAQKNILSLDSQSASAQNSTFQAMLENQITENAGDFVKAGSIVLKDNDIGNINLILRPENLGNVKISLELSDKVITGKILVASKEAFEAFNSTQESLKTAFIESGFDSASFDVAFSNQSQNFSQGSHSENQNSRQALNAYNDLVVENYSVGENNSDILNDSQEYSINIVA